MPDATARQLQAVLTRYRQLTTMLASEKTRRHTTAPLLLSSLDTHIAHLTEQRQQLLALLESLVASDPFWTGLVTQLTSVPGVGVLTATQLAVRLPELGQATRQQVAALAGVAPYACDSGAHRGTRRISSGRGPVRQALYQIMISALSWNPVLAAHYRQLRARHKPHKGALVACMRRLVGLLNAMLRDGVRWEELRVVQQHAPPLLT